MPALRLAARSRLLFPFGALLALLALLACAPPQPPERVVLVTIDTLRADHVGSYGDAEARTPVLDRLAERGVRFETAVAPTPVTLPSHASLLTARTPLRHRAHHNGVFRLPEGVPTLAERFSEAGWATAAFVSAFVLDRQFGLDRGFDRYDDRTHAPEPGGSPHVAERRGDRTVDAARAWLADAPERFFLWVHLYDPHHPYEPPEGFGRGGGRNAAYAGEVAFADAQLGRLLDALRERGLSEGTLVVATSDHGESLGEHGEPTHSYGLYDATQRVPLLMRGPGLAGGRVVERPVRLVDVAPTLLDGAGLAPLEDARGRSLLPLLAGDARGEAPPAYLETLATRFDMGWSPLYGLRTRRYKYVRAPERELYDLRADPEELRNLAEERPERVERLDARLEELLEGAPPIRPNRRASAADREKLASLGYVLDGAGSDSLEPGVVEGEDPKRHMHELRSRALAASLLEAGRLETALARLESIEEPGYEVSVLHGMAALRAGRLARAAEVLREAAAREPSRQGAHALLGRALERKGEAEAARRAYRRALDRNPAYGLAHTGLGRLAEARADYEEAVAHYRRGMQARPPSAEARWRLAALRIEAGATERAEALLAELSEAERRHPMAVQRLARAELRAGRPEDALERTETALEARPGADRLRRLRATLLEEAGRLEEALAEREALLAERPESRRAANAVAWTLARLGREPDRALELARRAASGPEPAPLALHTLATVHLARGEPRQALERAAVGLERSEGEARGHLLVARAEAYARLGREERAREALAAARREGAPRPPPSWGRALRRVEGLLAGKGREAAPPREG